MRPIIKSVLSILVLVFLFSCRTSGQELAIRNDGKLYFLKDDSSVIASVIVEISATPRGWEKGLMGRELSDFSSGMLFVFQDVKPRTFWMHNTPTSLDIIFIGEDYSIVNIAKQTTPMSDKLYSSKFPVKYVVEVKADFTEQYGIKEGTKIRWEKM